MIRRNIIHATTAPTFHKPSEAMTTNRSLACSRCFVISGVLVTPTVAAILSPIVRERASPGTVCTKHHVTKTWFNHVV